MQTGELRTGGGQSDVIAGVEGDAATLNGKRLRNGQADAPARPRNQRYPVAKLKIHQVTAPSHASVVAL